MTRKSIEFIYDCVSPNAYYVWQPLKDIAAKHGAAIVVTPVFLGAMHTLTGNTPPMVRDEAIKGKNAYALLETRRFIAKHGLTKWRMNPIFPFHSLPLQRMLISLDQSERPAFMDATLAALWEGELDVNDAGALAKAIEDAGFNAQALFAAAQQPEIKDAVKAATQDAVARGVFGIPSFFVGDELFFGKERLAQIEEELEAG